MVHGKLASGEFSLKNRIKESRLNKWFQFIEKFNTQYAVEGGIKCVQARAIGQACCNFTNPAPESGDGDLP